MIAYQTIVLSGGGAKGPYGLGVLLALEKFHYARGKKITKIYCGTSVGALNATLAAQGDLKQLTTLYAKLQTRDILGTKKSQVTKWGILKAIGRRPFHYFHNKALKSTIERYVKFSSLRNAHLLICATNYSTGELETFYISKLIDEMVDHDKFQLPENQRMANYHRIDSQEFLVQALLASTSIPFYLPPVKINKHLYVDGGVGNNTPLRQAAYICRFLSCKEDVHLEPTFCVINDPNRFTLDHAESSDMFGVIRRTLDIFHNELVGDSHLSWERINLEVKHAQERENLLNSYIDGFEDLSLERRVVVREHVGDALRATSTSTPRRHLPLMIVQPNSQLVENILEFNPEASKELKEHGVEACLTLLMHKDFISHNDLRRWSNEIE